MNVSSSPVLTVGQNFGSPSLFGLDQPQLMLSIYPNIYRATSASVAVYLTRRDHPDHHRDVGQPRGVQPRRDL